MHLRLADHPARHRTNCQDRARFRHAGPHCWQAVLRTYRERPRNRRRHHWHATPCCRTTAVRPEGSILSRVSSFHPQRVTHAADASFEPDDLRCRLVNFGGRRMPLHPRPAGSWSAGRLATASPSTATNAICEPCAKGNQLFIQCQGVNCAHRWTDNQVV